jgi:hypothetical protein
MVLSVGDLEIKRFNWFVLADSKRSPISSPYSDAIILAKVSSSYNSETCNIRERMAKRGKLP